MVKLSTQENGMEIFGVKVYGVKEAAEALPKMKHISGNGGRSKYSYGGVRDLIGRRYPDKKPHKQGAYMPAESVALADSIVDSRPRAKHRLVGKEIETVDFFGAKIVSLEAYASYRGYSLSNIRKVFYNQESGFSALFTILHGGLLLNEEEFTDFVAWVVQFGHGPRPKRKRPIGHRAQALNTRKTNPAKRVDPIME